MLLGDADGAFGLLQIEVIVIHVALVRPAEDGLQGEVALIEFLIHRSCGNGAHLQAGDGLDDDQIADVPIIGLGREIIGFGCTGEFDAEEIGFVFHKRITPW